MLYDCWRQLAAAQRQELALADLSSDRHWTFGELAKAAETEAPAQAVVFPEGGGADFVLTVLRGWRAGKVTCPLEPGQAAPTLRERLPAGIVHLKTTSATTGVPRLVAFTASQLMADAENIVTTMGLRREWPNLGVVSLAHSYGFSNLILPLLLHGIPLILAGGALPEPLRRAAATQKSVTLAAVPALWQAWLDAEAIPQNVGLAISAGAPLALELERTVSTRYGLKIHNFYGSSECGGIAYDGTGEPRRDGACAGAALKNVQVSLAEGVCVEVQSRAVAQSYWPEPDPRLGAGLFRTSDLGEITAGLIYLRGRSSEQINVAGRKLLPETIEAVLRGHGQVRGCLAFGVPSADAQRGETIVACVAADKALTTESLRQFALAKLPAWQVPREWWFVESLEVNHRGKLPRAEWKKRYLEESKARGFSSKG
jgi:acyl-CoA synthetase (AMP-forming)/AMP-acid ligase II